MKEITSKLGVLYVEEMTDEREEDRIKVFDSKHRYFDYVVENEDFNYEQFVKDLEEMTDMRALLDYLGVSYEFFTLDWKDVFWYFRNRGCEMLEIEESVMDNEWVNQIGNTYIVINEC